MIPILYESTETEFTSNGLGRLRDMIRCECTEERNGVYEVEFEYPITGAHYDEIIPGRIVAVEHDDSGDVQPFDIYYYSRPIDGIVTFRATHISYRLNGVVFENAANVPTTDLRQLFNLLKATSVPENLFVFNTDIETQATPSCISFDGNGEPLIVKQVLGGMEGSILDTFGGEYLFDKFNVSLLERRGINRDINIRYGANMTEFTDEMDTSEAYNACVPFWKKDDSFIRGDMVQADLPSYDGRIYCVPMDLSDDFEPGFVNKEIIEGRAKYIMSQKQTYLPKQNISVKFINLSDSEEYQQFENLQKCQLCDSIKIIFPFYDMEGTFKIVKVVWDVLQEKYTEMELGTLSTTLAQALGLAK